MQLLLHELRLLFGAETFVVADVVVAAADVDAIAVVVVGGAAAVVVGAAAAAAAAAADADVDAAVDVVAAEVVKSAHVAHT